MGPEEEAENWEDAEEMHGAGKVGRNADARSRDRTRIQPSTRGGFINAALEIRHQIIYERDKGYGTGTELVRRNKGPALRCTYPSILKCC